MPSAPEQAPRDGQPPSPGGPGKTARPKVIRVERTRPLPIERSRGSQAREAAEDVWFRVRRIFLDGWDDFRASDGYFKVKFGIVAAWVVISFASIGIAMSGGPVDPSANELRVYAKIQTTSLGWGLLVQNRSRRPWTHLVLELADGYRFEKDFVAADEQLVLGSTQFLKNGQPPKRGVEPDAIHVTTDQGDVQYALGAEP